MRALGRRVGLVVLALFLATPALAQEDIDAGKTPAQLYAQDCAICHKAPNGLAKGGGVFGLQSFLREHYTASKESAAAIAAYLKSVDRGPEPAHEQRGRAVKRAAKGDKKSKKPGEAKSDKVKSEEAKPAETKPAEAKPAEATQSKPAEAKGDAKPENKPESKAENKPVEAKPSNDKPSEAKEAAKPKPVEAKSDAKSNDSKPGGKPEKKPD